MIPPTRAGEQRGGRGLVVLGITLVVVATAVGALLFVVASRRYGDAVERFARAPVGCETRLDVTGDDEYFVYVETAGTLDERPGGCDAPASYERPSDAGLPRVVVEISDPDRAEVQLDRVETFDYDRNGYRGTAIRRMDLVATGDHVVTVTSAEVADPSDADFVIAIGRDPDDVAAPLRTGALALGAAGVVLGLLAAVIGVVVSRRWPAQPTPAQLPDWSHGHPWVPGQPPVTGPPPMPPQPPLAPPRPGSPPASTPSAPPIVHPPGPPLPPPPTRGLVSGAPIETTPADRDEPLPPPSGGAREA